jgi:hypothetical protein
VDLGLRGHVLLLLVQVHLLLLLLKCARKKQQHRVQIHHNNMSNMLRVPVVSRALLQAAALAVRYDISVETGCAVV